MLASVRRTIYLYTAQETIDPRRGPSLHSKRVPCDPERGPRFPSRAKHKCITAYSRSNFRVFREKSFIGAFQPRGRTFACWFAQVARLSTLRRSPISFHGSGTGQRAIRASRRAKPFPFYGNPCHLRRPLISRLQTRLTCLRLSPTSRSNDNSLALTERVSEREREGGDKERVNE